MTTDQPNGAPQANGAANGANGKRKRSPVMQLLAGPAHYSELQRSRLEHVPPMPSTLQGSVEAVIGTEQEALGDVDKLRALFPNTFGQPGVQLQAAQHQNGSAHGRALKVAIVLSGGQAPGGHNVITGLLDHLQQHNPGSTLYGIQGGPKGIMEGIYETLGPEEVAPFRNQGGFHMIGSGRDKIETPEQLKKAADTVQRLGLDGLVVCGGDDSNTNAAVLAEYFLAQGLGTSVIGVPKTIDGDLKSLQVATSFGFDTACKVYAEMIGNIATDALSAKKYYHFIRVMGRAASHIALECALQTRPQTTFISEEVAAKKLGLADITKQVADMVELRSKSSLNYGVVLIPEGLVEFVPEMGVLISELNDLLIDDGVADQQKVAASLSPTSAKVFGLLPASIRDDLLRERDPHGNVQVARIETEKLVLKLVEEELARRTAVGTFPAKFNGICHYFGYEGRCSLPSNFDSAYCYSLGRTAAALIAAGKTGLMATVSQLGRPAREWTVGGTPLTSLMCLERRKGKDKPVIRKALVELGGPAFEAFAAEREEWSRLDCYRSPGPIQFSSTCKTANTANITLALETNDGEMVYVA